MQKLVRHLTDQNLEARKLMRCGKLSNGDNPLCMIQCHFHSPMSQTVVYSFRAQKRSSARARRGVCGCVCVCVHACVRAKTRKMTRVTMRFLSAEYEEAVHTHFDEYYIPCRKQDNFSGHK
jgi:hypothetical protein